MGRFVILTLVSFAELLKVRLGNFLGRLPSAIVKSVQSSQVSVAAVLSPPYLHHISAHFPGTTTFVGDLAFLRDTG